ncbi:flagellar hook protein FlgE [Limnobacter parvus]|uniref:Flagellar hook protein FlgE n=1 Tax=Limnobacter parvus TaxID=2939690 RepID=A0ABT1XGM0_9BURK|nr:flagellar hook protein FlgE [Limnobacter parvus]MCR2746438.1 flagellar hook protein FlgE [Limnobacter parvus]
MAFSAGGSFQQGLSGLNAAQRGLEVIANNVSNASVVGFKGSEAEFSDVFARAFNGARSTNGIGLGTSLAAVTQNFKQGNINVTGNPLDLAISGTGFFKVQAGNGDNIYTRNGQFGLNNEGLIVNSRGDKLQGFPVDAATGRPSDVAQDILVPRGSIPPAATRAGNLEFNLDARAEAIDPALVFDPANLNTFNNSTSLTVYDELGGAHIMAVYMRKEASNDWSVFATVDGTQVDIGTAPVAATAAPAQSTAANLQYGVDGLLTTPNSGNLTVDMSRFVTASGVPFSSTGTAPNQFTFDMSNTTQYGSSFVVQNLGQDGYESSPFAGFDVGADGMLTISYANGQLVNHAQIGLYRFPNPEGLQPVGSNGWLATNSSGPELVSLSEDTAFGIIQSGALEESNIDLTAELVAMISAQRVYQANSQTIKTQDSIFQTITNLR